MINRIAILGSTGSIGTSTLNSIKKNNKFKIILLSANQNIKKLLKQSIGFKVKDAIIESEDKYFKYTGYFKNGRMHGSGEYIAKNNQTLSHYIGEWKEGKQDGYGTAKYNNGSTYDGEFKKGQKHGQGSWKWENVGKYEGGWKEGKRDGQGTYTYLKDHKTAEGIYIGQWKDGKRHGQGTYTKKDGTIQKGIWKDNGFFKDN